MSERKGRKANGSARTRTRHGRAGNGCGTLVKRGSVWHARWMVDGRLVSRSTGTGDRAEAEAWLDRMSVSRRGVDDREAVGKLVRVMSATLSDEERARAGAVPVADLYALWRDDPTRREVAPRTMRVYEGELHVLTAWIARRHPEIVSAKDVSQGVADEYIAERAKSASPNTVNKDLNLFCAVWRTLSRRHGLDYNPWTSERIARKRHRGTTRRALTDAEVDALLATAKGEMRLLILVGVSTGLRLGDAVALEWGRNVDLGRRTLTVKTSKTGRVVSLPILEDLHAALVEQRRGQPDGEAHVFPESWAANEREGRTMTVSQRMVTVFRRAGIETQQKGYGGLHTPLATFHSLRHTFVSRLIKRGVNPAIVRECVGHSTMLMTEHYTHIDADTLRAALAPEKRP